MAAVLLDTTVLIDVLRGRPGAAERLRRLRERGDTPYTCAVNAEEVARGLRAAEEPAARLLLEGLRLAPLTLSEGWQAGVSRRLHAEQGRTLSQADCLIAAAAAGAGATLATGNPGDFPMDGLEIEHWSVGE